MNWLKTIAIIAFLISFIAMHGQNQVNLMDLNFEGNKNIEVVKLKSAAESSSFCIQIKDQVKKHFHATHTESIYVLSGSGILLLNSDTLRIKPGDFIEIPPKTIHAVWVKSEEPLRVLSVQAPEFLGKDRHFVNE